MMHYHCSSDALQGQAGVLPCSVAAGYMHTALNDNILQELRTVDGSNYEVCI